LKTRFCASSILKIRLPDYRFPCVIFVSKLIDYFEVDTTNERNGTIKAASEINNSTLMKMGFHKEDDNWVFIRNVAHRVEHEASNHEDVDEENVGMHREAEIVQAAEASFHSMHHSPSHRVESPTQPSMQHMEESPVHSFMNEDVAATNYNALVTYQHLNIKVNLYQCSKDSFWTGWTHSQMIKRPILK